MFEGCEMAPICGCILYVDFPGYEVDYMEKILKGNKVWFVERVGLKPSCPLYECVPPVFFRYAIFSDNV